MKSFLSTDRHQLVFRIGLLIRTITYIFKRSFIITTRMSWAVNEVRMKDTTNMYKILVGIPLGKGSLGSLKRRWEGNNKIYSK
jgi:hypothetical protein